MTGLLTALEQGESLTDPCLITRCARRGDAVVFDGCCFVGPLSGDRRAVLLPMWADDVEVGDTFTHPTFGPSVITRVQRRPTDTLQRVEIGAFAA